MNNPKLLIFTSPSGGGKTTVVKHLLKQNFNFQFSISATTRKKRKKEKEGVDYYFISKKEFLNRINNNEFLEWEEVYNDLYYGTLKSSVDEILRNEKNVIFDVDVMGGISIKNIYGDKALSVFIKPKSIEIIKKRLIARGDIDSESLEERVNKAKLELKKSDNYDVILINDKLSETLKNAEKIVSDFLKV